ncbi:hypothetical protein [Bdellovibrio sp. HCB337]|uniref:hypothetical protein n=1 Tax=Bdellovibrio sp. HCB337 TaxID=3394358 RepID=UPI0039A76BB9
MRKKLLSTLVLASAMALSATAQARGGGSGVLFDVNLSYTSTKVESKDTGGSATTSSDGSTAIYDIKLGFLGGDGIYFGGIYTSRSESVLNQSGTSGSAMGASLGYMGSAGFFLMGHYLMQAKLGDYSEGSGIQVDLGYKAGVGSGWLLGGELTYRSIAYKKHETNTNLEALTITEVMPMLSIGYMF